jgi:hypothetical protein
MHASTAKIDSGKPSLVACQHIKHPCLASQRKTEQEYTRMQYRHGNQITKDLSSRRSTLSWLHACAVSVRLPGTVLHILCTSTLALKLCPTRRQKLAAVPQTPVRTTPPTDCHDIISTSSSTAELAKASCKELAGEEFYTSLAHY